MSSFRSHLAYRNFLTRFSRRLLISSMTIHKPIELTEREAALRQLLLDVSDYISTTRGLTRPELRFTGGWVRDKLLGVTSKDIDISISSMTGYGFGQLIKDFLDSSSNEAKYDPEIVGSLHKIVANPEKSKHLETLTTRILGFEIDLVNLRKEKYVDDSRNPIMEFGTPEDDANRRDATVNALFYNLQTSEVEDLTGRGLKDMELKLLKTPLSPYQTFKDDPLRILRSIRFASRLGYTIDPADEDAISDDGIKDALRLKISRERVGVEITKMLQGPNPHTALSLIDRFNLYNTIFTNPKNKRTEIAETINWNLAYQLLTFLTANLTGISDFAPLRVIFSGLKEPQDFNEISGSLEVISQNLLKEPQDPEDIYLAWIVCCFVPWARTAHLPPNSTSSKFPRTMAAAAAREGIKADNKITKIVEEASLNLSDVIMTKTSAIDQLALTPNSLERRSQLLSRELHGKALLRWGSHWRSTVIFALLVEITEAKEQSERLELLKSYDAWLSGLKSLDLLEVHQMKPIVDGKRISAELNAKTGPWMSKALDIVLSWQLRNPDETSIEGCIEEVLQRKNELGLS